MPVLPKQGVPTGWEDEYERALREVEDSAVKFRAAHAALRDANIRDSRAMAALIYWDNVRTDAEREARRWEREL